MRYLKPLTVVSLTNIVRAAENITTSDTVQAATDVQKPIPPISFDASIPSYTTYLARMLPGFDAYPICALLSSVHNL
jgi:hypothetical protein